MSRIIVETCLSIPLRYLHNTGLIRVGYCGGALPKCGLRFQSWMSQSLDVGWIRIGEKRWQIQTVSTAASWEDSRRWYLLSGGKRFLNLTRNERIEAWLLVALLVGVLTGAFGVPGLLIGIVIVLVLFIAYLD